MGRKVAKKHQAEPDALPVSAEPSSTSADTEALAEVPVSRLPYKSLVRSALNPRKTFHSVAEFAGSILAAGGLIHSLLVRPKEGEEGLFEVVVGDRRYRAIGYLIEHGKLPEDYLVPVDIRHIDDETFVRLALTENASRADMNPVDEGEALAELASRRQGKTRKGDGATKELARGLGRSQRWVQLRIALAERLSPKAKEAVRDGSLTLESAKALLTKTFEVQDQWLDQGTPTMWSSDAAANVIRNNCQPLSIAIFPLAQYKGLILGDEAADLDHQYFADDDEFRRLQGKALERMTRTLEERFPWVETIHGHTLDFDRRFFRINPSSEAAGALILIDQHFEVSVHEGVERVTQAPILLPVQGGTASSPPWEDGSDDLDEETNFPADGLEAAGLDPDDEDESPLLEEDGSGQSPKYTTKHLLEAHHTRSLAIQEAVMSNPYHAMRLTILSLLQGLNPVIAIRIGQILDFDLVRSEKLAQRYQQLADQFDLINSGGLNTPGFLYAERSSTRLWAKLAALPDQEVAEVFACLVAGTCGSFTHGSPHAGTPPIVADVASSLGITHGTFFELTDEWLTLYRKSTLIEVAISCGAAQPSDRPKLGKLRNAELRKDILESPARDHSWVPPEIKFQSEAEVLAWIRNQRAGEAPTTSFQATSPAEEETVAA